MRALGEAYMRVTGINDYFDAIRCFQWESVYNRMADNLPTYRRVRPVRWLGDYYPHFNPAFRKHALANFSYIEWRSVFMHALQLEAGVIRLTEAECARAFSCIKGLLEARATFEDISPDLAILKKGKLDQFDSLAGKLLRLDYEKILKDKFFEEAAKYGHTPDHFLYSAPVPEKLQYVSDDNFRYIALGGLQEGKDLEYSWLDHRFTFPRFYNRVELQTLYGHY